MQRLQDQVQVQRRRKISPLQRRREKTRRRISTLMVKTMILLMNHPHTNAHAVKEEKMLVVVVEKEKMLVVAVDREKMQLVAVDKEKM